jgi:hypothetical protein
LAGFRADWPVLKAVEVGTTEERYSLPIIMWLSRVGKVDVNGRRLPPAGGEMRVDGRKKR